MPLAARLGAFAAAVLACGTPAAADDAKTGFLKKVYKNADGTESPYVVFVPSGYDGTKPVPVILFLHGAGETKGGKKMPVEVGIGTAIKKQEKTFPAIVVIPQAEPSKDDRVVGRWAAAGANGKRALAMLDEVQKAYKTDPKRVYLTGLSMGGFGTWNLAAAHPDKWAAVVPICGGVPGGADAAKQTAEKIKDIPCWCFHGADDKVVPAKLSQDLVAALKAAGGKPKYTEYPGVGHNSWDPAYAEKELWAWLFEQKKK